MYDTYYSYRLGYRYKYNLMYIYRLLSKEICLYILCIKDGYTFIYINSKFDLDTLYFSLLRDLYK